LTKEGASAVNGAPATSSTSAELEARLAALRPRVESALQLHLLPPNETIVPELRAACEYAVFGGGKRLRPLVCLLAAEACGGRVDDALGCAAALEFVHCYSLVHDDLPAMDDDDFRRGRPTCHKVHGEAMAILAGDALLTRAFEVVARTAPKSAVAAIVAELASAAGVAGMVDGQAADLLGEGAAPTEERVRSIHLRKTAAMFRAAAAVGAHCAGASGDDVAAASRYGLELGLAFQVVDDLLGRSGDPSRTGKPVGKDDERRKLTYPAAIGESASRARAAALTQSARTEAARLRSPRMLDALVLDLQRRVA
jgi:geranylgeranyl diphosphate synthase type II